MWNLQQQELCSVRVAADIWDTFQTDTTPFPADCSKCYKITKSRFLKHLQSCPEENQMALCGQCWERGADITPGTTARLRARRRLGPSCAHEQHKKSCAQPHPKGPGQLPWLSVMVKERWRHCHHLRMKSCSYSLVFIIKCISLHRQHSGLGISRDLLHFSNG